MQSKVSSADRNDSNLSFSIRFMLLIQKLEVTVALRDEKFQSVLSTAQKVAFKITLKHALNDSKCVVLMHFTMI